MDENGASSYLTSDYEGLSAEFLEQQPAAGDLRRVAMELAAALAYIHQLITTHCNTMTQTETLCQSVEQALGHRMQTPKDFDLLREQIYVRLRQLISSSTLKRLWGYTHTESAPSRASLDVVARFIGYADYDAFCTSTGNGSDAVASNTVLSRHINVSADLKENDCLLLSWAPGRMAANYVCGKCGGIRFERI